MSASALMINELTKRYKKFTFGPVDLKIEKGTAIGLVGANGSGKSTLLRLLMNILKPDGGSIEFFGQNRTEKEVELKQKIGYAGDLLEPFSHVTIKELASLVSYWYPNWDRERYIHFLNRYNIDESMKYGKCSKGTKKKVEFIFSLCHNPKLLLLDEPSAGLDISSQRKLKEDLIDFMEDGERSLLLATHSIDEVKHLCDFVTVLEEGKIIYSSNKDDIFENWARLWVSEVSDRIRNHPNVLNVTRTPLQIITNHLREIETELKKEEIKITYTQRLSIEEVIEHFIDRKGTKD